VTNIRKFKIMQNHIMQGGGQDTTYAIKLKRVGLYVILHDCASFGKHAAGVTQGGLPTVTNLTGFTVLLQ
jgi:hypothetical protein